MKKYHLIIMLLFITVAYSYVYADGVCKNRNSCSWAINDEWQYQAKARTSKFQLWASTKEQKCPSLDGSGYCYAYRDNGCAWQKAENNWGAWYFDGSVYKNKLICARGNVYSDLYYKLLESSNFNYMNDNEFEKSIIKVSPTIYHENNVEIKNIKGNFNIKGYDLYSSFEIIMWLPSSDIDSVWTNENTFFSSKVIFKDGEIQVLGDFPRDAFRISSPDENGVITCEFSFGINAKLPKGVNGKENLIEVVGISDGGIIEAELINDYENKTKEGHISISPNPASSLINISFMDIDILGITLYNSIGQKIELSERDFTKSDHTISINLLNYLSNKGVFYLLFETNKDIILKKIIFRP